MSPCSHLNVDSYIEHVGIPLLTNYSNRFCKYLWCNDQKYLTGKYLACQEQNLDVEEEAE